MFRLFRLEWIVLVQSVDTVGRCTTSYLLAGPVCLWCLHIMCATYNDGKPITMEKLEKLLIPVGPHQIKSWNQPPSSKGNENNHQNVLLNLTKPFNVCLPFDVILNLGKLCFYLYLSTRSCLYKYMAIKCM